MFCSASPFSLSSELPAGKEVFLCSSGWVNLLNSGFSNMKPIVHRYKLHLPTSSISVIKAIIGFPYVYTFSYFLIGKNSGMEKYS